LILISSQFFTNLKLKKVFDYPFITLLSITLSKNLLRDDYDDLSYL